MTRKLAGWGTAAVAIVAMTASETSAQFGEQRDVEIYSSKRSFFERSGFGALALMPHVTSKPEAAIEFEYITLPRSGRYRMRHPDASSGSPDWWFIVNHRRGAGASRLHTYVGVFVAKRLEESQGGVLELYRNAGWRRLEEAELRPEETEFEEVQLEEFKDNYPYLTEFFELQNSTSTLEPFEQRFGGWHAIPDADASESSWLERDNWLSRDRVDECFRAIGTARPTGENIYFQARLIRFQVTMGLNSRRPVAWSVDLEDADAFYLKTFSPEGINIDREYCVEKQ